MNDLGFKVSWWYNHRSTRQDSIGVLDSFIQLLTLNELYIAQLDSEFMEDTVKQEVFVAKRHGSCTKEDQDIVRQWLFDMWLGDHHKVHSTSVGDLKEIKHSFEEMPAMFCEHANENPSACKCPSNCYCKSHTCSNR